MTKSADVFVLIGTDGKLLPPAVQATVLAKYSRSPLPAREIANGVTPEDAEKFQARWGVEYGHSSVAELCAMPYCFEGVSIIASKALEKYQRAGYSEKSTRYQVFSEDSFVEPEGAAPWVRDAAGLLYHTYKNLEQPVYEMLARKTGVDPAGPVHRETKARAFDNLRYLLPAGTGTNLAAELNARDARYMMSDLLGSHLPELRALGAKMVRAASDVAPVFAMGAKANDFEPIVQWLGRLPPHVPNEDGWWVRAVAPCDVEVEHSEARFWRQIRSRHGMTREEFGEHMAKRGKHQVPDVFKTLQITFDVMMDYGAFRDLQRHRRCEQYVEPLSPKYGYLVPDDFLGTEFEAVYRDAMDRNRAVCMTALDSGEPLEHVQYALPLGTCFRAQFQMDLREVYYIVELRTAPQGHISYRRVAYSMFEVAKWRYPDPMQWCRAINPTEIGEHH